jgi:hypothetical protein
MIIDYAKRLKEADQRFKDLVLQRQDAEAQLSNMKDELSRIQGEFRLLQQLQREEQAEAAVLKALEASDEA